MGKWQYWMQGVFPDNTKEIVSSQHLMLLRSVRFQKSMVNVLARHGVPDYYMITDGKHITVQIITLE